MPESTPYCSYMLIDNKIHQITLHSSTRQAIEDLFSITTQVFEEFPHQGRSYYLMDASGCGELPFRYVAQRVQQWNKENPNVPPSRTAIIYPMGMMASMFNVLIQQLSTNKSPARLFMPDKRAEAIKWLAD